MAKKKRPVAGALGQAIQTPPERPSTEALLDHLFIEMGGPAAVAVHMVAEFRAANPGSLFRLRFLEQLLRTLGRADAKNKVLDGESRLTDEDLLREIAVRERQFFEQQPETDSAPDPGPVPPAGGPDPAAGEAPAAAPPAAAPG